MVRKSMTYLSVFVSIVAFSVTSLPAEEAFKTNSHGLDPRNMDQSVDPCADFSRYANGNWFGRNPIPEEESVWSTFSEMRQRNYTLLREILTEAASSDAEKGSNKRKAGDFWQTAMVLSADKKAVIW